jgi:hypothetical protein
VFSAMNSLITTWRGQNAAGQEQAAPEDANEYGFHHRNI